MFSSVSDEEKRLALEVAEMACELMMSQRPKMVETKAHLADLVTELDREIEIQVRSKLEVTGYNILGEEFGGEVSLEKRTWVVDPIDGTLNYISGSKLFGFNLALVENQEVLLGVTYLPALDERYFSVKDGGLNYNGEILPKLPQQREDYLPLVVNENDILSGKYHPTRNLGAASVELAWTARGIHQATAYQKITPWDVAPGILFNLEMGNMVEPRTLGSSIYWDNIIIGSPEHVRIFQELQKS